MITYKELHEVYLNGKRIGTIKQVDGGFKYIPKGRHFHAGTVYSTVAKVKATLVGS